MYCYLRFPSIDTHNQAHTLTPGKGPAPSNAESATRIPSQQTKQRVSKIPRRARYHRVARSSSPTDRRTEINKTVPVLEIGESQQATSSAEQDSHDPVSTAEIHLVEDLPKPPTVAIEISEPTSSFDLGAYQRFTSSFTASGSSSLVDTVGRYHSSQDTAQQSGNRFRASSLPVEQSQSSNNDIYVTSSRFVPDSQSWVDASSFNGFSPLPDSSQVSGTQNSNQGVSRSLSPIFNTASETRELASIHQAQSQTYSSTKGNDKNWTSSKLEQVDTTVDRLGEQYFFAQPLSPSLKNSLAGSQPQSPSVANPASQTQPSQITLPGADFLNSSQPLIADESQVSVFEIGGNHQNTASATLENLTYPVRPIRSGLSPIFVSSRATGQQTNSPFTAIPGESSIGFKSQLIDNLINSTQTDPDYQPPPAGQRAEPSSIATGENHFSLPPVDSEYSASPSSEHHTHEEPTSTATVFAVSQILPASSRPKYAEPSSVSSSSVFPFQTQPPHPLDPDLTSAEKSESQTLNPNYPRNGTNLADPSSTATGTNAPEGALSRPRFSSDSSLFPEVPSQLSDRNIGESAPHRPDTILGTSSDRAAMESTPTHPPPHGSLATVLREMREEQHNKRREFPHSKNASISSQDDQRLASTIPPNIVTSEPKSGYPVSPIFSMEDGHRSPSVVPAVEPEEPTTMEEMNTSERYKTLLPQAQESNVGEDLNSGTLRNSSTPRPPYSPRKTIEQPDMHVVPVSLLGHQRDQYFDVIYYERELIDRFLEDFQPSSELFSAAERFIERMRNISTHPDLDNVEALTQHPNELDRQAQWDVDCSSKFRFLREFLKHLAGQKVQIALVTESAKLLNMLEIFLRGSGYGHRRLDQEASQNSASSNTSPIIILVEMGAEDNLASTTDVVIALENMSAQQHKDTLSELRKSTRGGEPLNTPRRSMLLTLVPPRTVEHIERCLSPSLEGTARLRAVLNTTRKLRNDAGKLEENQIPPKEAATVAADYLTNLNAGLPWPLTGLSDLNEIDSQTESEVGQSTGDKRPLDTSDVELSASESIKKPRITYTDDEPQQISSIIPPTDMEITHISDSIPNVSQPTDGDSRDLLQNANGVELRLQHLLEDTQARLDEHVKALEDLQYQHEEQRKQLIEVTAERNKAIYTAQQALERMNISETRINELRAERSELKQQLQEANQKLLDHSVPERRELETLRLAAAQTLSDKDKAVKRVENSQKELEWSRSMYQDASSKAQELAQSNIDLEKQLLDAQKLASGEQAHARQLSNDATTKKLQREIQRLQSLLRDREIGLKLRDEEIARLKESSRGRIGTRGSSVPRSPRLGSPVNLKGRGSRQPSPSSGEMRSGGGRGAHLHPLRNG